jgi:hypothetical protein
MMNGEKLPEAPKPANLQPTGHSALLDFAKDAMNGKDNTIKTPLVSSQASMGGAHNVAMAVLAEQSRDFRNKQQQQRKVQSSKSWFSAFKANKVSSKQFEKNVS